MKNIIISGLVTSLSVLLLSGCGGEPSPESHTGMIEKQHLTQKKVHKIILHAGEEAGWTMTEYKSNAIIAEKTDGDDTQAVTVKFTSSSYDISPENSELNDILEDALK